MGVSSFKTILLFVISLTPIIIFSLLFTWGSNSFGQLGYGEFDTHEPLPKLAKKLATKIIVQITCGDHHNLALTNGM